MSYPRGSEGPYSRDKMVCRRHCFSLLKLSVLVTTSVFIYLQWNFVSSKKSHEKLRLRLIHYDGNILLVKGPSDAALMGNSSYHMHERDLNEYDLRIITLVYDRADSLLRLLNSINKAEYYSDRVKLEVWIDRSRKDNSIDEAVVNISKAFKFHHGNYSVYVHPTHVGIYGQWLNTWKPTENSSEIAVFLEDDCIVSPLFYKYLKLVHKKYDQNPSINGYALQGVSIKHSGNAGLLEAPYESHVFAYPVLGTWGFSPSRKNWMDFIAWFKSVYTVGNFKPYVPNNIATRWYKNHEKTGKQTGMWSMWHIYFAWKNKEFTIYANIKGHEGLTANWKEAGLHYTAGSNTKQSNPLLMSWKPEYDNLPDDPVKLNIKGEVINA